MDLQHGGRAREIDAGLLPSQASVPEGPVGTLYRNGAGSHLSDHLIDGDGPASSVTFARAGRCASVPVPEQAAHEVAGLLLIHLAH
ncbi:carotenoid oxygenase family protein [Streptomyces sp. NBC_01220]|uniref:hypothetical protein n=1 Tax=Streptomyces sp. NBC_01220 TaxID=2903781 RepID=UPI00352C42F4|nr:carotenoid oxygenase family protein [Streptomyces sp. NBC_01220]